MLSNAITQIGIGIGNVFHFLVQPFLLSAAARLPFDYESNSLDRLWSCQKEFERSERRDVETAAAARAKRVIATTAIVQHFYEIWYSVGNKVVQIPATTASVSIWETVAV